MHMHTNNACGIGRACSAKGRERAHRVDDCREARPDDAGGRHRDLLRVTDLLRGALEVRDVRDADAPLEGGRLNRRVHAVHEI